MIRRISKSINEELKPYVMDLIKQENDIATYYFLKALRKYSSSYEAYYFTGIYYLECGKKYTFFKKYCYETKVSPTRARKYLRKALKIHPNDPYILHAVGESFYRDNNYSVALKYFRSVVTLNKLHIEWIWSFFECLYLTGNYSDVLREYPRYIDFGDEEYRFYLLALAAYSTVKTQQSIDLQLYLEPMSQLLDYPKDSVAVLFYLELSYLADDWDRMKKCADCHRNKLQYFESPCIKLINILYPNFKHSKEIEQTIVNNFTPKSLMSHFHW